MTLTPAETELANSTPVTLHPSTHAKLFALGVRGEALTGGCIFNSLHVDAVCFLGGDRFEFARNLRDQSGHLLAIVIPCRDECGRTTDLAAWRPDTGAIATWRGEPMLGADRIDAPQIEIEGLRVFATPLEWLHADRRGVVILDPKFARWRLAERRLIVADAGFGRRLRESLRLPDPLVFVDAKQSAAA